VFSTIEEAIAAEKAIKGGSRLSKLKLIDVLNQLGKTCMKRWLNK